MRRGLRHKHSRSLFSRPLPVPLLNRALTKIPSLAGVESLFFPRLTKEVDCIGLWSNEAIDKSRAPGPAPEIPRAMREHFSYGGRVSLGR